MVETAGALPCLARPFPVPLPRARGEERTPLPFVEWPFMGSVLGPGMREGSESGNWMR